VAEDGFANGHFAIVCLVIFTGEVQETMQQEDTNLVAQGVAVGCGLAGGGFERDGEIAGVFACYFWRCGEAEDIGGFIFAAEALVELAEGGVTCEEDVDCSAETDSKTGAIEETRQA